MVGATRRQVRKRRRRRLHHYVELKPTAFGFAPRGADICGYTEHVLRILTAFLHANRCTTSALASCLGFYEKKASFLLNSKRVTGT